MPIIKVVSGGQTGVDQAAWRAAKACGIETGGWMPKGFLTEDGPRPEFAEMYGAEGMDAESYTDRTRRNAEMASMTLWLGRTDTPGFAATRGMCRIAKRPLFAMRAGARPSDWVGLFTVLDIPVLNIAGNRESKSPGIGKAAERFLTQLFRRINS